jgi:glycosyltransferase involved in cell wall biosynthesis
MHIDVVLPTLDPDIERLDRAVSSVLDQADVDPHLIVVDDSDGDAVANYTEHVGSAITYVDGPGTTLAAALNEGVGAGDAPLVARHDADDVSLPRRFGSQLREFERDETLDLLGTGATIVRPSGTESRRRVKEDLEPDDFTDGNPIVHGSVLFRREAFEAVGGYDERFPTTEDLELWLRMENAGMTLRNTDEPLYELHLHGDSVYAGHLRETKLMGHFAREHVRGRTNRAAEGRVLNDGDAEWIYETMSCDRKCSFNREMATELLRYGDRNAARSHVLEALGQNWRSATCLGLLVLSITPQALIDAAVDIIRLMKNGRIRRINEQ